MAVCFTVFLARPLEDRDANASFGYAGRCVVVGLLLVFIWAQAGPQTFSQLRGEMTGTFQARGLVWLVQSLLNMLNDAARLRAALTWQGSCGWTQYDTEENSKCCSFLRMRIPRRKRKRRRKRKTNESNECRTAGLKVAVQLCSSGLIDSQQRICWLCFAAVSL